MEREFGTVEKPNLRAFDMALSRSLAEYERLIGNNIRFGNTTQIVHNKLSQPLSPVTGKSYLARSEVPAFIEGAKVGSVWNVVFGRGSGTGSTETYELKDVIIPEEFKFSEMPERVIPREKDCAFEVLFPFFSIYRDTIIPNCITLEELSLADDKKTVKRIGYLGSDPKKYYDKVSETLGVKSVNPSIYLTVGSRIDGTRFGEEHAIYQNWEGRDLNMMQAVGFFKVEATGTLLTQIFEKLASGPIEA